MQKFVRRLQYQLLNIIVGWETFWNQIYNTMVTDSSSTYILGFHPKGLGEPLNFILCVYLAGS